MEQKPVRYVREPYNERPCWSSDTKDELQEKLKGNVKLLDEAHVWYYIKDSKFLTKGKYFPVYTLDGYGAKLVRHGTIENMSRLTTTSDIKSAICQTTQIPSNCQGLIIIGPWKPTLMGEESTDDPSSTDLVLFFNPNRIGYDLVGLIKVTLTTPYQRNNFVESDDSPFSTEIKDSPPLLEVPICIPLTATLSGMKEITALATARSPASFELSVTGKVLKEKQMTVKEYCISDGSVIQMVFQGPEYSDSHLLYKSPSSDEAAQTRSLGDPIDDDKKSSHTEKSTESFFTGRSSFSQAFFSVRSRVTGGSIRMLPAPSKFLTTIKERGLLPKPEKEIDWSGRGQHVEYEPHEDVNLGPGSVLGSSRTAVVTKVPCRRIELARKTIQCKKMKLEDALQEVAHLQKLSHPHVVQLIGTYLQDSTFSILLYPVAEWELGDFLLIDHKEDRKPLWFLEYAVVCLLSAVEYIHQQTIRHMDIKPSNILVKRVDHGLAVQNVLLYGFRVLLADFGIAYDFRHDEDSQTEGYRAGTPTYLSPEVFAGETKGRASDMFSLGCVFTEIFTVCSYRSLDDFKAFRRGRGHDISYHSNLDRVYKWLDEEVTYRKPYGGNPFSSLEFFSDYVERKAAMIGMLAYDPSERPTATELLNRGAFAAVRFSPECRCKRLPLIRQG